MITRAWPGLCLLLALGGCTDRSLGWDPQVILDTPAGCAGEAPWCVDTCTSDFLQAQAACEGDDWQCPSGLLRIDLCASNGCGDPPPLPGEVCGQSGWICEPSASAYAACPSLMCAECAGFTGPVTVGGCTCACAMSEGGGGQVLCSPAAGVDPSAHFHWEENAGVVGSGRAVDVAGDGTVLGWLQTTDSSMAPPDFVMQVPAADAADLFSRFGTVDRSSLPHMGGGFDECSISGSVQSCASCSTATLSYSSPAQVLPEMESVWAWFDEHSGQSTPSLADVNPRYYCPPPPP